MPEAALHRVLIIGCGRIAGGFDEERPSGPARTHAGAYRAHGGFDLVGCVDPDRARLVQFASHWHVSRAESSIAAFGPGEIDVVSITSPTNVHEHDIAEALRLCPRLIFCEKPVSGSAVSTEAAVRQCAERGVLLAVNHTRRWAPDVLDFANELAEGQWGAVRSVSAVYNKGVVHNGGHMVDLLHLLFGPLKLTAIGRPVPDFWTLDPSVPALLETVAGVPVVLMLGDARDGALFELTIVCEKGEVAMRDGGLSWTFRRYGPSAAFAGYQTLGSFEMRPGRYDEAMVAAVANLSDALDFGAELASTGETALAAQRLCEQMRDAAISHYNSRTTLA